MNPEWDPKAGSMRYDEYRNAVQIFDGSVWTDIASSAKLSISDLTSEIGPDHALEGLKLKKRLIAHQDNPLVQDALDRLLATLKLIEE